MAHSADIAIGLIGAGMMGQEHIQNFNLLAGAHVTAIADTDAGMRDKAAAMCDREVAPIDDFEKLLADPNLDAFVIATPNFHHIDVLRPALETGKPILCEKPLCTTLADTGEILASVGASNQVFQVGMEYRFKPALAEMIARVDAGETGKLQMLTIREHRFPFLQKVGDWNRFNHNTGGTLVEKCCHFFDLMRLILKSDPVRVMASAGQEVNHLDEAYDGVASDIWDSGYVIVDFASGARAMLELSMFAEGSEYQEMIHAVGGDGKLEVKLPGPGRFWSGPEEKRPVPLLIESRRHPCNPVVHEAPVDATILDAGDHNGSTYHQHRRFLDVVRGTGTVEVGLDDGIWAVRLGQAAQVSARTGQAVTL